MLSSTVESSDEFSKGNNYELANVERHEQQRQYQEVINFLWKTTQPQPTGFGMNAFWEKWDFVSASEATAATASRSDSGSQRGKQWCWHRTRGIHTKFEWKWNDGRKLGCQCDRTITVWKSNGGPRWIREWDARRLCYGKCCGSSSRWLLRRSKLSKSILLWWQ